MCGLELHMMNTLRLQSTSGPGQRGWLLSESALPNQLSESFKDHATIQVKGLLFSVQWTIQICLARGP